MGQVKLYSYCVRFDNGTAPNPYWGWCTLAICKPAIRRAASEGDWIVGTGSKNDPRGDLSGRVIFVMQVTDIIALEDYDAFAGDYCPRKIPRPTAADWRWRLGDAIYDFSTRPASIRPGDHGHTIHHRRHDLGGSNVLTSRTFWYFGGDGPKLKGRLRTLVIQGKGHRSTMNGTLLPSFLNWIKRLGRRGVRGRPASAPDTACSRSPFIDL